MKASAKISGVAEGSLEAEISDDPKIAGPALSELLRSFDRAERRLLLVLDEAQVLASAAHSDLAHTLRAGLDVRKQTIKVVFAGSSESSLRRMFGRATEREGFIRSYVFPAALLETLSKRHTHLVEKDNFLVARALREFFLVRARTGSRLIGMPSKVVDDLWHEFILHTREYERFCRGAFGQFFHHVPASATPKGAAIDAAMRVTWRHACLEENISLTNPTRLPLLFAIDEKLAISDGHRYNTRQLAASRDDSGSCGGTACSGGGTHGCSGHGCGGHCGGGGCGGH